MRRGWLVAFCSMALVVATASPSSAVVTATFDGGVIDDDANDLVTVRCEGGTMRAGPSNSMRQCGQLLFITVFSGGGTDDINLSQVTAASFTKLVSTTTYASGNGSTDTITGSPFLDFVMGDSFDTAATGAGDDIITGVKEARGEAGNDTFRTITTFASGGEGDDRFVRIQPQFGVDGGVGTDVWELELDTQLSQPGTTLVLDQSALVVTEPNILPNSTPATTLEEVVVTLSAIDQSWDGTGFPGRQDIRGLAGSDAISGGPGRDVLDAGPGDDAVTGGAGGDALTGGDGNDTINARDGEVDLVDCGAGTDTVVADAVDGIVGCETVDLPVVVTPPVVTPPVVVVPVTGSISGSAKVTKPKKASFKFSSPTGAATFQCKVDGKAWKACASPYKVATKKLKLGKHTLRVRAVLGGQADATPSVKKFRILKG